jgi:hypothetical protein
VTGTNAVPALIYQSLSTSGRSADVPRVRSFFQLLQRLVAIANTHLTEVDQYVSEASNVEALLQQYIAANGGSVPGTVPVTVTQDIASLRAKDVTLDAKDRSHDSTLAALQARIVSLEARVNAGGLGNGSGLQQPLNVYADNSGTLINFFKPRMNGGAALPAAKLVVNAIPGTGLNGTAPAHVLEFISTDQDIVNKPRTGTNTGPAVVDRVMFSMELCNTLNTGLLSNKLITRAQAVKIQDSNSAVNPSNIVIQNDAGGFLVSSLTAD